MRWTASSACCARCTAARCRSRKPLHLCTDETVIGAMFYLMQYVDGRVFWDPVAAGAGAGAARRGLRRDHARAGGAARDRPGCGRPGRLRQARQLLRAPGRALDASSTAPPRPSVRGHGRADRLAAREPSARRRPRGAGARRLPHRQPDVRSGRAARAGGGGLGIVDAGPAAVRPRLFLHGLAAAAQPGACPGWRAWIARRWAFRTKQALVAQYRAHGGRVDDAHWRFLLAFSFFRLAAIAQGVAKRAQQGNASSDQARSTGNLAGTIAELGRAVAGM